MTQSGLLFDVEFTDATLPSALTYDESIGASADLIGWWVPDQNRVTLSSGRVANIASRGVSGVDATQATAGNQPLWSADGGPKSRPMMTFDKTRVDRFSTTAVLPLGGSAAWSKIVLARHRAETTSNVYHDMISGTVSSSTTVGSHRLSVRGVNTYRAHVGETDLELTLSSGAFVAETWQLLIQTFDTAIGRASMSVNGGAWAQATVAGAALTNGSIGIGSRGAASGADADIADLMVVGVDLAATANAALLATIKQYFRDRYDMTIS